jgi:hypothetical protein
MNSSPKSTANSNSQIPTPISRKAPEGMRRLTVAADMRLGRFAPSESQTQRSTLRPIYAGTAPPVYRPGSPHLILQRKQMHAPSHFSTNKSSFAQVVQRDVVFSEGSWFSTLTNEYYRTRNEAIMAEESARQEARRQADANWRAAHPEFAPPAVYYSGAQPSRFQQQPRSPITSLLNQREIGKPGPSRGDVRALRTERIDYRIHNTQEDKFREW